GEVEIVQYKNPQDKLCVKVKDTGIGISDEYLKQLFTPFSQEETGYTRRFEGNGLGLAIVKKYIELNNADIRIESKKGTGTEVTVSF
ncbi:MAG: ATP-binding protein, partial [Methanococcaceae archaeon]